MNQDELKAIKARAEAATPGPWVSMLENERFRNLDVPVFAERPKNTPGENIADVFRVSNHIFIAHSRTDIPALIAYIEELQADKAQMLEDMKAMTQCRTCMHVAKWPYWSAKIASVAPIGNIAAGRRNDR